MPVTGIQSKRIYLLPGFDEYIVAYKDRSAAIETAHIKQVMGAGNALFKSTNCGQWQGQRNLEKGDQE